MVPVNALWIHAIEPLVFFNLGGHYIFKRTSQSGVIENPSQRMRSETLPKFALMLEQRRGYSGCRKRLCKIQMQASVNLRCSGNFRRSLRVHHKNHRTDRGDSAEFGTLEGAVCSRLVPTPVIRIHN
jgi:hypothetical protein